MAPLLLTNSNGEYGDGSSDKTPHIVVLVQAPPLVAHTLQLLRASCWWGIRKAEDRESIDTLPRGGGRFKRPRRLLLRGGNVDFVRAHQFGVRHLGPHLDRLHSCLFLRLGKKGEPVLASELMS